VKKKKSGVKLTNNPLGNRRKAGGKKNGVVSHPEEGNLTPLSRAYRKKNVTVRLGLGRGKKGRAQIGKKKKGKG